MPIAHQRCNAPAARSGQAGLRRGVVATGATLRLRGSSWPGAWSTTARSRRAGWLWRSPTSTGRARWRGGSLVLVGRNVIRGDVRNDGGRRAEPRSRAAAQPVRVGRQHQAQAVRAGVRAGDPGHRALRAAGPGRRRRVAAAAQGVPRGADRGGPLRPRRLSTASTRRPWA